MCVNENTKYITKSNKNIQNKVMTAGSLATDILGFNFKMKKFHMSKKLYRITKA